MIQKGFSEIFAYWFWKKTWNDFFHNNAIPLKQKFWGLKRGFWSSNVKSYRLSDKNYEDYLSDFDYYRLHPINGIFSRWIDDKLTLRYILAPYSDFLPEYYYHLYNGEILNLPDTLTTILPTPDNIIDLLKEKQVLALKPVVGKMGENFCKLEYSNGCLIINEQMVSRDVFHQRTHHWSESNVGGYLITEFITPNKALLSIWNKSSSIRIIVLRGKNQLPQIAHAYIRFGTESSGFVDNPGQGAIWSHIGIVDGSFENGYQFGTSKEYFSISYHPDTKKRLKGVIPNWHFICEKIIEISNTIPEVIFMGYDVFVTEDSFKIIEINSHPGFEQISRQFLTDPVTKPFFNGLLGKD